MGVMEVTNPLKTAKPPVSSNNKNLPRNLLITSTTLVFHLNSP